MQVKKSTFFLSVLLSAFASAFISNYFLNSNNNTPRIENNHTEEDKSKNFFLLVDLEFADSESLDIFYQAFKPLSEYVLSKEKGTLTYEVLVSDKNPNKVLILEKYINKDYYLNVHKTSEPFLTFRPILSKLTEEKKVIVNGNSYTY